MLPIDHQTLERVRGVAADLMLSPPCKVERRDFEAKGWCKSERELWKHAVDYAVCFANAEGGILFLGPDDKLTLDLTPPCPHTGVTADWLADAIRKWTHPPVECCVYRLCDLVERLSGGAADCLVVYVPKKKILVNHVTHAGVCLIRHEDACDVDYHAYGDDYSALQVDPVRIGDLSRNSLTWAFANKSIRAPRHARWRGTPRSIEDHLSDFNLVGDAGPGLRGVTLSCLLLFGQTEVLKKHCDGTFLQITVSDMADLSRTSYTYVCEQNMIETLRDLWGHQGNIWGTLGAVIPERCLQELVVNAFIHRDYRLPGPINIKVQAGHLFEIQNPGGLLRSLAPDNLINASPVHRNSLLSEVCALLGFCEKSGTGIDIVYQESVAGGFDLPYFQGDSSSFAAILPLGRDSGFARFIQQRAKEFRALESLLMIRCLYNSGQADLKTLARTVQRPPEFTRTIVKELKRRQVLEEPTDGCFGLCSFIREEIEQAENPNQGKLFH